MNREREQKGPTLYHSFFCSREMILILSLRAGSGLARWSFGWLGQEDRLLFKEGALNFTGPLGEEERERVNSWLSEIGAEEDLCGRFWREYERLEGL